MITKQDQIIPWSQAFFHASCICLGIKEGKITKIEIDSLECNSIVIRELFDCIKRESTASIEELCLNKFSGMESLNANSVFIEEIAVMCRQKLRKLTISDMYDLPL